MNIKNIVLASLVTFAVTASYSSAQTITGFGSGDFTIDGGDLTTTQTAGAFTISGTDGGGATTYGSFVTVQLTSFATSTLALRATATSAPSSAFTVDLYDSDDRVATWTGSWSSFTVGSESTVNLTFITAASGFNGNVYALQFNTAGVGAPLSFSFDNLAAVPVPEPSAFAAIAGIAMLGAVAYRRRRVAA